MRAEDTPAFAAVWLSCPQSQQTAIPFIGRRKSAPPIPHPRPAVSYARRLTFPWASTIILHGKFPIDKRFIDGFSVPDRFNAAGQRCSGKRESGASPERSGHCKRGERLHTSIVRASHEKARPIRDPQVRKPAETIRCMASDESWPPRRGSVRCGAHFCFVPHSEGRVCFRKKGGRAFSMASARTKRRRGKRNEAVRRSGTAFRGRRRAGFGREAHPARNPGTRRGKAP